MEKTLKTNRHAVYVLYLLRQISLLSGVVGLGLFLSFMLFDVSALLFADKSVIDFIVGWQSTPGCVVFDFIFVIFPCVIYFVSFLFSLFHSRINIHQYHQAKNWHFVFLKISGIMALVFMGYHISQLFVVYFGSMTGHQYIQTIIMAHKEFVFMILFWAGLFVITYHWFVLLWHEFINTGICARGLAQKLTMVFCVMGFILVFVLECVLFIKSVLFDVVM